MAQTAQKTTNDTTASSNILFINKVKINNDGTAAINFSSSSAQNAQEVAFQGKEEVTKDFFETFQATVKSLLNALPRLTADEKKITMNVIAFNYGKDEFLSSAGYSAKYAFNDQNNAVLNLNMPPLPIYKEGMESTFCISGKDEELLHEVIKHAKAYINGETRTKQMKLVVDNTNEDNK